MTDNHAEPSSTAELRAEIEATRAELADTVDQLTDKLDVKAQAQHKIDDAKASIGQAAHRAKEATPAPVQSAVDRAQPLLQRGRGHERQLLVAAGLALAAIVLLRRRNR